MPDEVKSLDKELRYFASIKSINELSSDEAAARVQHILDQCADLQRYLRDVMAKRTQDNEADPADQGSPSPAGSAAPASPSESPAAPTPAPPTASPAPTATP